MFYLLPKIIITVNYHNKMAFRSLSMLRALRTISRIHRSAHSSLPTEVNTTKSTKYTADDKLVYLSDPDTFGTLAGRLPKSSEVPEDPGDIKEQEFLENRPFASQKLTTKQYADLIKQYLQHKRLKEAIDVLEVRMLKEDRAKPENYIYNILIGACAEVGYTKKAFKLFNDMKRRALTPTGDTYTCLFEACANSPWQQDGLKNALHLRELMKEKQIEPNLTNYNAMIKAFGRCGDLATAFQIVDEMISKNIKIRVHTLNHLLQACISDKDNGLRHALVVWRKLLKLREKPNVYSFNLMLKCVKDCNLGSEEDIQEIISIIQEETPFAIQHGNHIEVINIDSEKRLLMEQNPDQFVETERHNSKDFDIPKHNLIFHNDLSLSQTEFSSKENINNYNKASFTQNTTASKALQSSLDATNLNTQLICENSIKTTENNTTLEFVEKPKAVAPKKQRTVPNLLSKVINMEQVLSLKGVSTTQEKFAIIGGQEDFLKEMEAYSIKPDIKTFTQMLFVIDESNEAELKLLETMKQQDIKADIDFYNMLIKRRCLRSDYDGAFEVKQLIAQEQKYRKKKHFLKKKLRLEPNIMTYGVLAMACQTREKAETLLQEMKQLQLKVNIQILGTLLRNGTAQNDFGYVTYIIDVLTDERIAVNDVFIKHLELFNDKCENFVRKRDENGQKVNGEEFEKSYRKYLTKYKKWLKDINIDEVLKPQHPWQQFRENYPQAVQRDKVQIVEPKRFYKRSRKFVEYVPRAS